jgi:hypothetical protein
VESAPERHIPTGEKDHESALPGVRVGDVDLDLDPSFIRIYRLRRQCLAGCEQCAAAATIESDTATIESDTPATIESYTPTSKSDPATIGRRRERAFSAVHQRNC